MCSKITNHFSSISVITEIYRFKIVHLLPEVESRTQDSRPRPRAQKNPRPRPRTAFPRTDTLEAKDRNARGQGQECSRPRPRTKDTSANALQKKKVFTKIFQAISTKKRFPKNFSSAPQSFNNLKNTAVQKILLSKNTADRPIFEDLRPRGQGLDLRGQGLQNVSSRPRTSSRTPPLLTAIFGV